MKLALVCTKLGTDPINIYEVSIIIIKNEFD